MPSNESFVDEAEKVIKSLRKTGNNIPAITTSKIRNLLAMTSDIYNEVRVVRDVNLTDEIKERIAYLRVRCIYEAGRNPDVREFVGKGKILERIKSINTKDDYIGFSRYMEALVAWHRYLGGRDS